jgi:hypothetical protein
LFFAKKTNTKIRQLNIFTTVAPKKASENMVGNICRTINMDATTKSVNPDRKKNINQNCGVNKSACPYLFKANGGIAMINVNQI